MRGLVVSTLLLFGMAALTAVLVFGGLLVLG